MEHMTLAKQLFVVIAYSVLTIGNTWALCVSTRGLLMGLIETTQTSEIKVTKN